MTLEFTTDVEAAKTAKGTRLVTAGIVPSPWSEAAKGVLRLARIPTLVVRRGLDSAAIDAWTGIDNVPALLHFREPVRSNWAAITAFADRHAPAHGGLRLLPDGTRERAHAMGVLSEIAGEQGVGWNGRLAMIELSLATEGARGFPLPVAKFLAKRYGHVAGQFDATRARVTEQLGFLAAELAGRSFFGGDAPNAIDVYLSTFLTPIAAPITVEECPAMLPPLRAAFAAAHDAFGSLVAPELLALRERMFATYLPRPIEL